jgi:8-oxo-dGTP pyrophosphatase MutT (NUDIX family)
MNTPPAIETVSSTVAHQTKFTTVRSDQVRFPDGSLGDYTTVTLGNGLGAVVVVRADTAHGMFYALVGQWRYPTGQVTWEFPGGGVSDMSAGEALREMAEETGVDGSVTGIQLGVLWPASAVLTTRVGVWMVTVPEIPAQSVGHIDHESFGTVRWVSQEELTQMIRNGELGCGISLAAYAMLQAAG